MCKELNMDVQDQLLHVTKVVEKQVDAAIEQIDNLDLNDLEQLRKQRMKDLKEQGLKRKEWQSAGHGNYDELAEEKQFFDIIKKSEHVILHFYTNTNERSKIVDMHFKALAPKHIETLFRKINAEKCPFLTEKLKIKTIPCIVCIQNGVMIDKIIGFTTLGNRDDFTTDTMEWRLAQSEVIQYEGDLTTPPDDRQVKNKLLPSDGSSTRKIRSGIFGGDDDDLYIDDDVTIGAKTTDGKQSYELTAEEEAELGL